MNSTRIFIPLLVFIFLCACKPSFKEPEIALDSYEIADGFVLEVLASEPLLKAPVALDFDDRGRMWVAQMPGYMNDMQGSDEDKPVGSIRILEDWDGDGVADHAKIFLDSLVMPRALAHVYGGLLYAEPPTYGLWKSRTTSLLIGSWLIPFMPRWATRSTSPTDCS
jgi:glucose/arabinose dehydrogenase